MRREIFAGNWKMYKTYKDAIELVQGLKNSLEKIDNREIVVFPPAPYAKSVVDECGSAIGVGMQNMYYEKEGAFTGEVSPEMVKDTGCKYVLIGHSERRHVFGEDDALINKKVIAAFEYGLVPMLCVGELLEERESGKTNDILKTQIIEGLKGLDIEQVREVVIAYEPVWAIGTGKVATPEMADEAHAFIRGVLKEAYTEEVANIVPILYGGSVKPDNVAGLYEKENIDGALVGGASLKVDTFSVIMNIK